MWIILACLTAFVGGGITGVVLMCLLQAGKDFDPYADE